jgi:UDP-glucose 4-epimerase
MAAGKTSSGIDNPGVAVAIQFGKSRTRRDVLQARRFLCGFGPRRAGDPATLIASIERIAAGLNWHPARQNLVDIIQSAWKWMMKHSKARDTMSEGTSAL